MTLKEWAIRYARLGLHPIPLKAGTKVPAIPSWKEFQERQPTEQEIESWWGSDPHYNIGLVLGRGLVGIDYDTVEAYAANPPDPAAPVALTGKGAHAYYRGTAPDKVGLAPGVDVRGVGYLVAPPSMHESGHEYTWIRELPPFLEELPPLPRVWVEKLQQPAAVTRVETDEHWATALIEEGVHEGGRDHAVTRLAGLLWGKGLPQDLVESVAQWFAATRTFPPLDPAQVSKCVTSIVRREGGPAPAPSSFSEVIDSVLDRIMAPPHLRPKPAPTALDDLDRMLDGGLYPGALCYLAARPSVGKSAFALQMARRCAEQGKGVLIISLEMSQMQIVSRILSATSGIQARGLRTGELDAMEKAVLREAAAKVRTLPLWITTHITSADAIAETIKAFDPGTLGLVVLDYLQLVSAAGLESRAKVEHVSKVLKRTAIEADVPVLALSSLVRPPRNVANWRPQLADMRESGELEHDADVVIMMHREELVDPAVEVYIRKQRDGEAGGHLVAHFDLARQTFTRIGDGA